MNRGMGPQIDVPVGVAGGGGGSLEVPGGLAGGMHQPGWNGLTIKEILEKVDLFNITVDDGVDTKGSDKVLVTKNGVKQKEGKTVVNVNDPEAAYLGPKLWDKPVSLPPLDDTEFSIMNIDDFLNENNISLDADPIMGSTQSRENTPDKMSTSPLRSKMEAMEMNDSNMDDEDDDEEDEEDEDEDRHDSLSDEPSEHDRKSLKRPAPKNLLPKSGENGFLYAESKRARAEREKEEKKRKYQMSIEFAPEDLALATIPGADFDPRRRAFSTEELRPQPIIRKRRKQYVPNDSKDGKYWEKRLKNNIAARRSREARRLKENQIALRAAFLEKENATLKAQIDEVNAENGRLQNEKKTLQEKLRQYEQGAQHF